MDEENRHERISQAAQTALNVSHGVKNLLQAVKGGVEVVDYAFETGDVERAQKGWTILKRNLYRINKLVLDMLTFSKESEPEFTNCNLNSVVTLAVESLRAEADNLGVSLVIQTDDSIPDNQLDADMICDVVLNLVLNAIDAVSEGAGAVNVTTELDSAKGLLILRVSDNGPGVEDADAIFEPFHSAKAKVGTGLGLPIARKIVSQHGGTIKVDSIPGQGATFTVTLQAKQGG
ncbi:MAG: two-component system sensor histidine kinase NtrB [Planctomycetota bacterium]|jgi:signal transduction histidine kinase